MFQPLNTSRIALNKITPAHASQILQGLSNAAVTKYMLIHYNTLQEVQEQMAYYKTQYETQKGMYWAMEEKQNQQFIGVIGINNVSIIHKKAELGFWVLPEQSNQGFVTEASKEVLAFCFDNLQLNRVEATVETENMPSITVLKKLGFTHEGTFREYEINQENKIDLMMFSILQSEFNKADFK